MKKIRSALALPLAALWFTSCAPADATFKVTSKHFGPNGTVGIYRLTEQRPLAAVNLNNATQELKVPFAEPGYYRIEVNNGQPSRGGAMQRYFIYLKGGEYEVRADTAVQAPYPVISSDVEEEEELIAFYKLRQEKLGKLTASVERARQAMQNRVFDDIRQVSAEEGRLREKLDGGAVEAVGEFAAKYPESAHTPFLLDDLDEVTRFPLMYRRILLATSTSVQNDKLTKKLLEKADDALGREEGAKMAGIAGQSPDGRKFDPATDLKKLNLIIVWASYDNGLRKRHPELVRLYQAYKSRGLQVISVSLDKEEKWWKSAIAHDALPWPQFADLQGAKSPNARKLSGMMHPYLFLVDQGGRIIKGKLLPQDAILEIQQRL